VRLKKFIEQRGADAGAWRSACVRCQRSGRACCTNNLRWMPPGTCQGLDSRRRQALRDAVPVEGLEAKVAGRKLQNVALDVLAIARGGLDARNNVGPGEKTEAKFIDVLDEIAQSGNSAADDLLALYKGQWQGDIDRVFRDFAF
jgi:glutamate--cysteine ligase